MPQFTLGRRGGHPKPSLSVSNSYYKLIAKADYIDNLYISQCKNEKQPITFRGGRLFVYHLVKLHFQVPVMWRGASAFDRPCIFSIRLIYFDFNSVSF